MQLALDVRTYKAAASPRLVHRTYDRTVISSGTIHSFVGPTNTVSAASAAAAAVVVYFKIISAHRLLLCISSIVSRDRTMFLLCCTCLPLLAAFMTAWRGESRPGRGEGDLHAVDYGLLFASARTCNGCAVRTL